MKFFTESPVSAEMLHPRFKYLVDRIVGSASDSCSMDDIDNIRSESEFRFGILQARSNAFGNPVFVCFIDGGNLKLLTVEGDDFEESALDMSPVPRGMEELYITTYIQNVISEIDPFVDYDVCQVLCDCMDPINLISYEDISDDIVH